MLAKLNEGWEIQDNILSKKFQFKGFLKTMSFVNAVAWEANRHMHHPDMKIGFNYCEINLTTHDEGNQVTDKDFKMAMAIDGLF